MSRHFVLSLVSLAIAALALTPTPSHAQSSRSLSLFPHQAAIHEPSSSYGLVRLPLPPDVLAGAASDLGDLRVHDAQGLEVPYAIDRGDVTYPVSQTGERRAVVPFDAQEQTRTSGGITTSTESYRVRPPAPPSYGGTWQLLIDPQPSETVRQVIVRAEPAFGEAREIVRTSIFRFARYGNERLAITLPGVVDEPLAIEITGEGPPIHPSFALREVQRTVITPTTVDVPLAVRETRREGTRTILVVARPRGLRTESILVDSSTLTFVRNVEVFATTSAGRVTLGSGGLVRVAGVDIPDLRVVRLADGGNDVIEVVIEDGDSPPLADVTVSAATRVPALLFDAGRAQDLRWGGHRARAPRYDLMSADLASLVRDRELVVATLGPIVPNPDHDDTPALSFAMRAGQTVERSRSTHVAPLTVIETHDGLSRFAVTPAMWAAAREDLADLRVVDGEARQWPYVLTMAPPNDELEATVAPAVPGEVAHHSRHVITLPVATMSPLLVRIELPPQLVARLVTVRGLTERGEEHDLGVANFLSSADAPARLELSLFGERVTSLWLDVDDGDEAPLAIERVTIVQAGHEVQLVAPAGEYTVLVGDLDATAPTYDVADAWELLAVLESEDATLGALVTNPEHREPSFFERSGWETFVLSGVLGLVVLVLFVLTLRIARSEAETQPAPRTVAATAQANEPPETKAEETKAEETKAEETKAEETKAEETKAEETKAEETKAEDTKTDDVKPEGPSGEGQT